MTDVVLLLAEPTRYAAHTIVKYVPRTAYRVASEDVLLRAVHGMRLEKLERFLMTIDTR